MSKDEIKHIIETNVNSEIKKKGLRRIFLTDSEYNKMLFEEAVLMLEG